MHITVVDTRKAVVAALEPMLMSLQLPPARGVTVSVALGDVRGVDDPAACFVNAGNAVGDMSGRLDAALAQLVPGAADDVHRAIQAFGDVSRTGKRYLPLFSALMSPASEGARWLLTAPCTFTGGAGTIRGTRNAFHATHSALSLLVSANRAGMGINHVVFTGVGTGRGKLNRDEAARQMTDAFRAAFVDNQVVTDSDQSRHPRLLLNRVYSIQPVCRKNDEFQIALRVKGRAGIQERAVEDGDFQKTGWRRSGGSQSDEL